MVAGTGATKTTPRTLRQRCHPSFAPSRQGLSLWLRVGQSRIGCQQTVRPSSRSSLVSMQHTPITRRQHFRQPQRSRLAISMVAIVLLIGTTMAAERRAPAPKFSSDSFRDLFFVEVDEAIRGDRPRIGEGSVDASASSPAAPSKREDQPVQASGLTTLISPQSLEDEIKRLRLELQSRVTTPAAFKSGEFQSARVGLTALASLFAVIAEHQGEVRWKADAAAARDLLARTASNCKSGSSQVYNEVKLRKIDLEDLVSGSGLGNRQAEPRNDWSLVADRVPLMTYAESIFEGPLKEGTQNAAALQSDPDRVRRSAELLAVVGFILGQDGLADADDDDYAAFCKQMIEAAGQIGGAARQGDAEAVFKAVGTLSQVCARCHEAYR